MVLASFHRARRYGRRTVESAFVSVVLSVLASLAFVGLILLAGLFVELYSSAGRCEVSPEQAQAVASWAGAPTQGANGRLTFESAGLIPWAVRLEGTRWSGLAHGIVSTEPGLRANRSCLAWLVAAALLLVVVHSLSLWMLDRVVLAQAADCTFELRRAIATQAFQLGGAELPNRYEPPAAELFSDRAETVRYGLLSWWRTIPRMAILAALLLATAVVVHVWLAIAASLLTYVFWTIYAWTAARIRRQRTASGSRVTQQMAVAIEALRKVRLARSLSLAETPGQPLDETLAQYRRDSYARDVHESILDPLAILLIMTAGVLVLAIAGANILQHPQRISFAAATVLYLSLVAAWLPMRRLYWLRTVVRRASRASTIIFQYLDREPKIGQLPQAVAAKRLAHELAFESVTFSDGSGRRLLDGVSLSIPAASTAAIVCIDAATRQAVAALLGRFLDPAAGRILYDGVELRTITLDSLRQQLALILEEDWVFTGSVADNLSCGNPTVTAQHVAEAARRVHLWDAVQRLPHGLSTVVGEHGLQLPVAMRWRLALARAWLRDPAVAVIEEPAAPFDGEDAATMDETLKQFVRHRTAIFLPTRLSTLRSVSRVFVLANGKLQATGSHADLLQESELYRHWNYLRFNPFR